MPVKAKAKIEALKKYFSQREDVLMAFIFGSYSKKRASNISDWDIAVYFKPISKTIEWENSDRNYPEEDKIWGDLIEILKTDNVDLLILNRAPANIAAASISGIPLSIKDQDILLKFMLVITREAEDYRQFVDEYYAISQRSASLTPQDKENLKRTVSFLEEQMDLYSYFTDLSHKEYVKNIHIRNEVERWVENIINAGIDISKIILASQKKPIPQTYRETLKFAVWELKLDEEFIERFEKWVKLRNILAHEYLDIKWERISNFIKNSEYYFKEFIKAVKEYL